MSNDTALINAREKALLEEEKWLIENLHKIKLQIKTLREELLYFRDSKAETYKMMDKRWPDGIAENAGENSYSQNAGDNSYSQNTCDNNDSQNAGMNNVALAEEFNIPEPVGETNPSNIDDFNLLEENCNEMQNLNLNIIPNNKPNMDMMEPEYETDEEEGDWYNVQFDMSVLVSGHCNQFLSDSNE